MDAMGPSAAAFVTTYRWSAFIQFNPLLHVPAFVMGIATQRLFLLARSSRSKSAKDTAGFSC